MVLYLSFRLLKGIEVSDSEIKSIPLAQRRRLLGLLVPVVNLPLFLYNLYQTFIHIQEGLVVGSQQFWEDAIVLTLTLFITILITRFFPLYPSRYFLMGKGLTIKRFLRSTVVIPYKQIDRVEVYIRVDEETSKEATEYATDQSSILRKSGFKFNDYTNAEKKIMNLFTGKKIYMISPEKPKSLLKELKRRNRKLTARIIELTKRGKRIRDLK